jgi:hypothetical protein
MPKKYKPKRVYQQKMWDAAQFHRKEAEKCYKARAYFSAVYIGTGLPERVGRFEGLGFCN